MKRRDFIRKSIGAGIVTGSAMTLPGMKSVFANPQMLSMSINRATYY